MKRGGAALAQVRGVIWASSGAMGMSDRTHGDDSGTHANYSWTQADYSRTHGDDFRTHADYSQTHADYPQTHVDDSAPARMVAWWRAWRGRFGLAEVCGTAAAVGGFAAGYLTAGSLLAAAGVATACEAFGFYGCIGARTVAAAGRATAHLGGWRRLAAGAWHAVREQLASCAVAEALDGFLVRPGCIAGGAWLLRGVPGGVWLGFLAGKIAADVAWYGMEACARRGVVRSVAAISAENPRHTQSVVN
jgi:hypothetical protein